MISANATIYVQEPGQYRLEAGIADNGESWTRVVTRSGSAEIVTDRGSSVVREEESMTAQGDSWARLELAAADSPDALERWSEMLADRAQEASGSARYVEPQLAYDAAPLDEAGSWVEYENVRYWRPYVASDWRPYWQGRWSWTPSGYTWISYEPWGWVPYHYGRWCSLPGYGWAWRPGAVYSPAWVYWTWTSDWAGWVPMGYYSQYYDPWYRSGFRYGVYGWAGGGWGIYSEWNFAPVHCFRDRNFRGNLRTGRERERESRLPEPPRGLVTTDTRDFRPDRIDRTDHTEDLIHRIGRRQRTDVNQTIPDVTDFVGRKGKLPTDVARVVLPDTPASGGNGRKDDTGRKAVRDIGTTPKLADTPTWKRTGGRGSGGATSRTGIQEPPLQATGSGRKGEVTSGRGTVIESPGAGAENSASGQKGRSPQASPRTPEAKVYSPGPTATGGSEDRQQWKEKGGESAPVQRVIGSVRRTVPAGEEKGSGSGSTASSGRSAPISTSPSYNPPKAAEGARTYAPAPNYGKGSPDSPATRSPSGPSKGSASSQGSPSAASPTRGSAGSQPSRGSTSYDKGSAGSQGSSSAGQRQREFAELADSAALAGVRELQQGQRDESGLPELPERWQRQLHGHSELSATPELSELRKSERQRTVLERIAEIAAIAAAQPSQPSQTSQSAKSASKGSSQATPPPPKKTEDDGHH